MTMELYKKNLLEKFLTRQCSEEEQREVRILLNDPEAKDFLRELMMAQADHLDGGISLYADDLTEKAEALKKRLNHRIAVADGETGKVRRLKLRNLLQYAAMWTGVLMVIGLAVWKFGKKNDTARFIVKENLHGVPIRYRLPDSSTIYLAAGSKLTYPENYPETGRNVQLDGEAFFEVTHDAAHPFIIHTDKVQTYVLGTSFKVMAFKGEPIEVAVATGKVGVSAGDGSDKKQLALLTPGRKLTYDPKTGTAVPNQVDIYSLKEWITGDLIFDVKPLAQVAAEIGRRYGVQIIFDDKEIALHQVSGSFPSQYPVGKTLNLLGDLGNFSYTTADNKVFKIHKKGHMQK